MLVTLNDVLPTARQKGYAVGLFNTVNLEQAKGVLAAAEALRSPVIVGTAEVLLPFAALEEIGDIVLPMARRASVPVVVHYDHGLTFEKCMEALKLGFTSVMYDCSTDTYEENVRKVTELCRIAHAFGATVEGELGHVGDAQKDDPQAAEAYYTQPDQAVEYQRATQVDALAVAVGTAHGAYRFKPKLDFTRIEALAERVPVPLVLHGGSGLTDEDFHQAIARGIAKVNIFTDIDRAAADGVRAGLQNGKTAMTALMADQVAAVQSAAETKMRLFGSVDRA